MDWEPTNLLPVCDHMLLERVNIQVAPVGRSYGPPTASRLPLLDNEHDDPCSGGLINPEPTSFPPCCVHIPSDCVNTQVAPIRELSPGPPIARVLASDDNEHDCP